MDKQTDRHTDRQKHRQTDRETELGKYHNRKKMKKITQKTILTLKERLSNIRTNIKTERTYTMVVEIRDHLVATPSSP